MTKLAEQLKHGAGQAWESLAEGWRELGARASGALTRFWPGVDGPPSANAGSDPTAWDDAGDHRPSSARWSFMAVDVYASRDRVLVRIEAPGMTREDFRIEMSSPELLSIAGHKRFERAYATSSYALVQSAYGSFRRDIQLPVPVDVERAKASYEAGVLRVDLPRREPTPNRRIEVRAA
ncbi:MAG: Hsp20/alpha crystallin family protein [Burkholderiales bacterium]|nr:Hsp20/alpha crystallin family protein [Burkholderiales bacterium]